MEKVTTIEITVIGGEKLIVKSLLAEDDELTRTIVKEYLGTFGQCDVVSNGSEAFRAFMAAHDEGSPFDLICLDIMMPGMNGHETLEEIRIYEEENNIVGLSGVKVMMTTGKSDSQSIMKAFRNQCEAYLIKPISADDLITKIKELGLID